MSNQLSKPVVDQLQAIDALKCSLANTNWFYRVSAPLEENELSDINDYLKPLSIAFNNVKIVKTWQEAKNIVSGTDWSEDWWNGEENSRKNLRQIAERSTNREELFSKLENIVRFGCEELHSKVVAALSNNKVSDPALARCASGAAMMSINQAALAIAAQCSENHHFIAKYRLFKYGRWPLGVYNKQFFIL